MMNEMETGDVLRSTTLFEDGFGDNFSNTAKFHDTESLAASEDFLPYRKGLTIATCALFIVGQMAGSGVLALPKAMLNTGWTGVGILVLCCLVSLYCGIRLGECWILIRNRVIAYKTHVRDPYPAIGFESYGNPAKRLVELCVLVTLFGVCVVFLLMSAQNIASIANIKFGNIPETQEFRIWVLICCCSLLPFNYLATPKDIWPLALGASVFTATACVLIVAKSLFDRPADLSTVQRREIDVESFFSGFATMVFTFGGAAIFPTFQTDMRKPKDFPKAAIIAFGIVLLMYVPTASIAYLVYGDNIQNNVLTTMKKYSAKQGLVIAAESVLTAHLLFTYVITLNPIFQQVEEYLRAPKHFGWKRVIIRTSIVLLCLGFAEAIPHFGPILELIGGSSVIMMTFILPCVFYLKLKRDCPLHIKILHIEIVILAIMSGCMSTYAAIQDLREAFNVNRKLKGSLDNLMERAFSAIIPSNVVPLIAFYDCLLQWHQKILVLDRMHEEFMQGNKT